MEKDKDKKQKDKKQQKEKEKGKDKDKDKKDKQKEKDKNHATESAETITHTSSTNLKGKKYTIVVFDGNSAHRWDEIFANQTLKDGSTFRIVQCSWMDAEVVVYGEQKGCMLSVAPVRDTDGVAIKPAKCTVTPHFVLMRNQPRGPIPANDRRHVLFGLMMANVPAINSLMSEYMNLERPIMYGALREIEQRVGHDKFPLVPINYYSSPSEMVIGPEYPAVMKVSHAHAGMGKMKLENSEQFRDFATVLSLNGDYTTAEPFIKGEYGIRVQKMGSSYRVYRKIATGSGWKSQFGGAELEVIELTDTYKLWVDEASKSFGGMDLLAIDAIHGVDGTDHIIEMNGTAIGIKPQFWVEDTTALRTLCLQRMNEIYCKDQ